MVHFNYLFLVPVIKVYILLQYQKNSGHFYIS